VENRVLFLSRSNISYGGAAAKLFVCLILTALLPGCLPSLSEPNRLYPVNVETTAIRTQIDLPDFRYYIGLAESQKQQYRNTIIDARMYAIDLEYFASEADETHERQEAEFLASAANIGLTGASVLVPAVQTKNILAGVAGGITGVNAAYDDKVLLSKTIQVLQNQMRAERARVAVKLFAGMNLPASGYGLGMALSDLETYYRAGTITGALLDLTNTVSTEATQAKFVKDTFVVSYGYGTDDAAVSLRAYVYPNGKVDAGNYKKIQALMPSTVKDPLSQVLRLPQFAAVRDELRRRALAAGYKLN
jgi:hypothetical protein